MNRDHLLKIARFLFLMAIIFTATWGCLALWFAELFDNELLKRIVMVLFALTAVGTLVSLLRKRQQMLFSTIYLVFFLFLLMRWNGIEASNQRDWQTDVAVLASAEVNDNLVTMRNIRNFDYQSESDYKPAYYDKTYDLDKLQSLDLVAVYWMGPAIAHTFVSFGFEDGEYLSVSIEIRKEKSESYSTIKGFFRQYELHYVVADERDVIRLRTNYRKNPPEDVYIYRTSAPLENIRQFFLEYVQRINALHEQPEFYNTLTDNCTTGIWMNSRINPGHLPLSWKILASGYVPEYLYEKGRLDTSLAFPELQQLSLVNPRAQSAGDANDFSARIRHGLPLMHDRGPDSN